MLSLLKLTNQRKYTLIVCANGSGPLIARARNELLARFLETEADYFLSVDSDIIFEPSILHELIQADKPIISAHYVGVDERGKFPVANIRLQDGLLHKASYKTLGGRKGIKKVTAVGMGFCLIKREVLETLDPARGLLYPFAEVLDPETGQTWGEDVTFCIRAAEAGFESFLDLDAKVDHLKLAIL
jgi:GT2 family glycosyltransferase